LVEGRWPDQRHRGRLTESPFLVALAGFIAGWLAGYDPGRDDPPAPIEQLAMAHARELWRNRHIRQNLRPQLATWALTRTEQQAFLRRAGGASYNQIARELGVTEGTIKTLLSRARRRAQDQFVNLPAPLHMRGKLHSKSPHSKEAGNQSA
jgi:DNA-binding CsgD family transcriptional regulator